MSRKMLGFGVAFIALSGVAAGCGWVEAVPGTGAGGSGSGSGGSTAGGGGAVVGADTGVPCDVQQVLSDHCWSCHGSTPTAGALPLVTYAEVSGQAQTCLDYMNAGTMPKGGTKLPQATIDVIANWVTAGTPKGSCTGPTGPDPLNAAATCTSGTQSPYGEGSKMRPGQACNACHQNSGEAPIFALAGTVFPTGHEPNNCEGASGTSGTFVGLKVVVTDAAGKVITMNVNSVGNFTSSTYLKKPYTAKVVDAAGKERAMAAAQTNGDCNSCHTQNGTSNAPGRITVPN